jgi:hypothetical protein
MSRLAVVQRLKDIERGEVGEPELPINDVKYNTAYYGRRVSATPDRPRDYAWCVTFQWWCFQKAKIPTSIFPKSASVFAVRDWFKKKKRFYKTPMVGDLVIFSRSHIGFVEKILEGNRIQTIEGNEGNAVRRKKYKANDPGIQGYCRPEYHKVTAPPAASPGGKTEAIVKALPRLKNGDKTPAVARLQALLRANGQKLPHSQLADGSFDGDFGDETQQALKAVTGSTVADDAQWAKLLGV